MLLCLSLKCIINTQGVTHSIFLSVNIIIIIISIINKYTVYTVIESFECHLTSLSFRTGQITVMAVDNGHIDALSKLKSKATKSFFQAKSLWVTQNMRNHQISVLIFNWWNTDGIISYLSLSVFYRLPFPHGKRLEKIPVLPTDCRALMTHGASQGQLQSYLVALEGLWDLGLQRLGFPSLLFHPKDLGKHIGYKRNL